MLIGALKYCSQNIMRVTSLYQIRGLATASYSGNCRSGNCLSLWQLPFTLATASYPGNCLLPWQLPLIILNIWNWSWADSQWTPSELPADSQRTPSGLPVDSHRTPSGLPVEIRSWGSSESILKINPENRSRESILRIDHENLEDLEDLSSWGPIMRIPADSLSAQTPLLLLFNGSLILSEFVIMI